jgi:purine-binding chemotaxis protein CheW
MYTSVVTPVAPRFLAGEYVVFALDDGMFAVTARDVREIVFAVRVAPLPGAPEVVEGLVNVRGTLAPVFDLRKRFGLPPRAVDPSDHLVLATAASRLVAFRADRVVDFARFAAADVEAAIVDDVEHVAGVAKTPDGLVLIHDLTAFLSVSEADALDEALRAAPSEGSEG